MSDPLRPVRDNELVFQQQLCPLVDQIMEICEHHGIPLILTLQITDQMLATRVNIDGLDCSPIYPAVATLLMNPDIIEVKITPIKPHDKPN